MAVTLVVLLILVGEIQSLETTVDTTSGIVEGKSQYGAIYFLGIPYAEPPVGEKRFRKPVPKTRMAGNYNATYYRPRCPQLPEDPGMDENCLYLNIYAPEAASPSTPKSVMVWVHGGSYLYGSGQDFDGLLLVLFQDVIVVNINYRLGALGFLNTKDSHSDGNQGLWDQTLAIRWVKENIANFGGNANNVTIFGESAGSGSITQLSMSPNTEGLFQRVIAESGTAFAPWSNYNNPVSAARKLGELLDCPTTTNTALLVCLRIRPVSDIVKNQHLIEPRYAFSPTYNSEFLPHSPSELITSATTSTAAKRFADLDFIIGLNVDEGGFYYTGFMSTLPIENPFTENGGITQEVFDYAVDQAVAGAESESGENNLADKLTEPLKFQYTGWKDKGNDITRSKMLVKLLADSSFIGPIAQFARAHVQLKSVWGTTEERNTYMYLFKHRGSWMPTAPWRSGADHADEIAFVFGHPHSGLIPNVTECEKSLSSTIMAYWTNFAKTGNTNMPDNSSLPTVWPLYEDGSERYIQLDVGMTSDSVGQYVYNDRAAFWTQLYPKLVEGFRQEPLPNDCSGV